jgi:Tfp pilus assembly protein PilV
MNTFLGTLLADLRRVRRRFSVPDARSEDGFLMVEVIISALLVALIVFATFNGFDVATRLSSDQRHHNQAALLAAQSQEQLRSDPASALDLLETTPHSYLREVSGTKYTITQEAKPLAASGKTTGCKAGEASAQNGANIQVSSTVTWPQLSATAKRPAVKQASIISPPTGSTLEVDATNGGTLAISGVTATAKYIPVEAGSPNTVEGTTGSTGCVVLTGLAATSATVEIAKKAGWVTTSDLLKFPTKEVTIAPNITTHYPVVYDEAGKIIAEYTYKGESTWEGKAVRGDTFVAFNANIPASPGFEVGSPNFEYKEVAGEERFKALTNVFEATASTPHGITFANGELFPFPSPARWQVYAGDCTQNSVETVTASTEKISNPSTLIEPGKTSYVKVPLSLVALNVYAGTKKAPLAIEAAAKYPVQITNTGCQGAEAPNNSLSATVTHAQATSAGHLENPFQPFGTYELCLTNTATKRTETATYTNKTVGGTVLPTFYQGEISKAEREAAETAKKTQWSKELTEGKITSSQKTTKENTLTTERNAAIAEEGSRGYTVGSAGSVC